MFDKWRNEEAKKREDIITSIKEFESSRVIPNKLFNQEFKYNSFTDVIFSEDEITHLLSTKPSDTKFTNDEFIIECRHLVAQHHYKPSWVSNSKTNKALDSANKAIQKAINHIGKLDSDSQFLLMTNYKESLRHLFNVEHFKCENTMRLFLQVLGSAQCSIELSIDQKPANGHDPFVQKIFDDLVRTWENVFGSKAAKTEGKFKQFVIIMFCHFGNAYEEPEKRIEKAIKNSRKLDEEINRAILDSRVT